MSRLSSIAAFAVLAMLGSCSFGARAYVGYLRSNIEGDVGLTPEILGTQVPTQTAAVDDGLGIRGPSDSLYGRLELDSGLLRLTASGFRHTGAGRGRLDVQLGDIVAGAATETNIDLASAKAALSFDIDLGSVRVSPGVGATVFDLDMTVVGRFQQTINGVTFNVTEVEEVDEVLPVPMAFVQGELDLGTFGAVVDVGGVAAEYQSWDLAFVDIEAIVYARPIAPLELFAGYRWIGLDLEGDDGTQGLKADLDISGWFIGGGLKF